MSQRTSATVAVAATAMLLLVIGTIAPPPAGAQEFDDGPPVSCLGVNVINLEDVIFGNAGGSWEYEGVKNGLPVVNVVRGSPAALVGVRTGDFIVMLNGQPVYLPAELVSRVQAYGVGERFELQIYRRGEMLTASGALGQRVGDLCQPAPPSLSQPPSED
jgi:membrane-associated protease RseP (regulator of RpoE activity)